MSASLSAAHFTHSRCAHRQRDVATDRLHLQINVSAALICTSLVRAHPPHNMLIIAARLTDDLTSGPRLTPQSALIHPAPQVDVDDEKPLARRSPRLHSMRVAQTLDRSTARPLDRRRRSTARPAVALAREQRDRRSLIGIALSFSLSLARTALA